MRRFPNGSVYGEGETGEGRSARETALLRVGAACDPQPAEAKDVAGHYRSASSQGDDQSALWLASFTTAKQSPKLADGGFHLSSCPPTFEACFEQADVWQSCVVLATMAAIGP